MDPKATLKRLEEAIRDKDFLEAQEALEDLADWVRRGGFLPVFSIEFDGGQDDDCEAQCVS